MKDSELIRLLSNPETRNAGFNHLVREYQEKVYWQVRRMVVNHDDANDITQEVFIKIYKYIHKFRKDSKLYTWIYRIAANTSISFLNKKKLKYLISFDDVKSELNRVIDNDNSLSGDKVEKILYKAMNELPPKQKLVFQLKYFNDLKYEVISEITGTSVGALKASYHLAVKKIEEFISES